jgi:predicted nucleotidyltransferase
VSTSSTAPTLDQIAQALRPLVPVGYRAVLFGSRAGGRAIRGSDWDIGILGPAPLDGARMTELREALEAIPTLHSFDLVDLGAVPDEFRETALRSAVPLT